MQRILLVDDSADSVFLIQAMLKDFGSVLAVAENGQVALDRLKAAAYDLVLMDMRMPVMDGYEAVKAIRAREAQAGAARMVIVAMTAVEREDERLRMTAAGCDAYLQKPIRKAALAALLQHYAKDPK